MAVADRSIDPRILDSARTEFLTSGFEKASLKTICEGPASLRGRCINGTRGKRTCSAPWWNRRWRTCMRWPMPGVIKTLPPCLTRN